MDPWICCAKWFSSWFSIKVLMAFILIWLLIIIGVSGWLTESDGGSLAGLSASGSSNPYTDWTSTVCNHAPYKYLVPFSFRYRKLNLTYN